MEENNKPHYVCRICMRKRGYEFPIDENLNTLPVGNTITKCAWCNEWAHCYMLEDLIHIGDEINE